MNGGGREAGHVRTYSENVFNAVVVVVWNSGSRSRPLPILDLGPPKLTTFRHESSGAEAATPRLEREELGRRGFADLIEVVMVEAREQGVFNLDDRDESRVKKKDKTQIHSIYIFDPRSYFH